ncbi:MAG TPA: hypothetical protein DEQ43_09755 [Nocardioides bacterium]|nr:hypothetical protein [Nocardioides sp.]
MRGRPKTGTGPTAAGVTPQQWAAALGPVTPASLRKAQRVITGATPVWPAELLAVAAVHQIEPRALLEGLVQATEGANVR